MKIKEYKCIGCQREDFDAIPTAKNPNVIGLFCSYCGKFLKWASKDEKNLVKIGKQQKENG